MLIVWSLREYVQLCFTISHSMCEAVMQIVQMLAAFSSPPGINKHSSAAPEDLHTA